MLPLNDLIELRRRVLLDRYLPTLYEAQCLARALEQAEGQVCRLNDKLRRADPWAELNELLLRTRVEAYLRSAGATRRSRLVAYVSRVLSGGPWRSSTNSPKEGAS